MRPPFPLIAILLIVQALVCGCATSPAATAPGCHGPRRPANAYGTVLAPAAQPAPTAAATSAPPCGSAPQ